MHFQKCKLPFKLQLEKKNKEMYNRINYKIWKERWIKSYTYETFSFYIYRFLSNFHQLIASSTCICVRLQALLSYNITNELHCLDQNPLLIFYPKKDDNIYK